MNAEQVLLFAWRWDWVGLAVCLGILGLRFAVVVRTAELDEISGQGQELKAGATGSQFCLWAALAVLILALFSPVRVLAEYYLFSAHMAQHLLLLLAAPPLLLLSLPRFPEPANEFSRRRFRFWATAGWLSGVGAMWVWHIRVMCDAATTSRGVFHLQTLSLLAGGILFWLPICGPLPQRRLAPLSGIGYLFSACLACTLLGIYITFTPLRVCSIYAHPADPLGILPLIRTQWGLTPTADQQFGGLMMWVPACLIYLSGILGQLARWYGGDEEPVLGAAAVATPQMKPQPDPRRATDRCLPIAPTPHPNPLPRGEGATKLDSLAPGVSRLAGQRTTTPPLPPGDGRGEGKPGNALGRAT